MAMLRSMGIDGAGGLPFVKATSRLLGALINFLVIRPSGLKCVRELGTLEIVVPLMEATGKAAGGPDACPDEHPSVVATRALTLASRLVKEAPEMISIKLEVDILQRIDRILERECRRFGSSEKQAEGFDDLDLAIRTLSSLIIKREGVLDRLTEKAPRCQELPEGVESLTDLKPALPFGKLISRFIKLMSALKKDVHANPDDEESTESRIRGNLALLFAKVIEAQVDSDVPQGLKEMNFLPLVDIFVEWLRKERGPVQQNIGVCLTRLATNPQYRQRVRDLKGIESLHQIMLPKVEAQKAEASRLHRLRSERGLE